MATLPGRLSLILAGLLAGLAIAEAALRVIGFGEVTPQMSFGMHARIALDRGYFVPDPVLFWKVREGIDPGFERAARIVHPDRTIPPKEGKRRIVILGDSCSRVSDEGPLYSMHLEDRLGPGGNEVLNASIPGYTSHQGLLWLRSQLLEAEPDVVVVFFGWNDHWRTTGLTDREYARTRGKTYPRLLTLLERRDDPPPFRVPLGEYRENLEAMADEVVGRGGSLVLVAAPYRLDREIEALFVRDRYLVPGDDAVRLHREYLEVVRELAGRPGVSVLEADSLFQALGEVPPLLRRDGIHLTDSGHRALGAMLAELVGSGEGSGGVPAGALLAAARRALAGP